MLGPGSQAVIDTGSAIYEPCTILEMSAESVRIVYVKGMVRDDVTGQMVPDKKIETIPRSKIISMSERT